MAKHLLSALIGIIVLLAIVFCYQKFFLVERSKVVPINPIALALTSNISEYDSLSIDNKIILANFEERIDSINKRIDDLLIFGGIIITLLLAINVAVYVNAESIVEKHLKENYQKYNEKIRSYVNQAEIEVIRLRTEVGLIIDLKAKLETKPEVINANDDTNREPKA